MIVVRTNIGFGHLVPRKFPEKCMVLPIREFEVAEKMYMVFFTVYISNLHWIDGY